MRATQTLRQEHELIWSVLECLERLAQEAMDGARLDRASVRQALEFLRGFADRCHHAKEEQLLFPALVARGMPAHAGPIAVMLSEHEQGRDALARMVQVVEEAEAGSPGAAQRFGHCAAAYVALLREHIHKENEVLFPMADRMLGQGEQAQLALDFERAQEDAADARSRQGWVELAGRLCERIGVAQGQG